MSSIDLQSLHELDILKHVEKDRRLNTRLAARKLDVSLKLAHEILKRMVNKGLLHVRKIHSRRWDYFLTPSGLVEKTRLTLEFLDFSMQFYREARRRSSQVCRDLAESGQRQVAFLGSGDLAEIAYLGVQEWDLELVRVYSLAEGSAPFMGMRTVLLGDALESETVDLRVPIIVCLYDARMPLTGRYLPKGVPELPNLVWVFADTVST